MSDYIAALCCEITAQGRLLQKTGLQEGPSTVYFGGGTPTVLPADALVEVIAVLRRQIPFFAPGEFTVEANPGTVDARVLEKLYEAGVNRLSFGVQSFSDARLRSIGRIHTAQEAVESVQAAKAAGFTNISLDLMYGLPGQTLLELKDSIEKALALGVPHLSIYGLQVEAGTVFERQQAAGTLCLPDEDTVEQMYDLMTETLPQHGYRRYEISNFAQVGFESRHNLGYWKNVPYLGLGMAAHSYWQGQRLMNAASLETYLDAIQGGRSPAEQEEPATRKIQMEEFAFLALRTAEGIEKQAFFDTFGLSLIEVYGAVIEKFVAEKLLVETPQYVFLTSQGMKYGNRVFAGFLLD